MAVHDSGGATARLFESFQQTDDKDTRGRRVFGRVKNISYFWIMLKPCGRSRSQRHRSLVARSVLQGYDVFSGPG